jgi:transcriptional regulator with XRE-family HTH domain
MQRFAEKLRTLRLRHNMTQQELADALGVQQPYIYKLESGRKKPNVEHVIKLARLFGVTADMLIMDEQEV